ncbi:MAG: FkbM family methyltransferase [Rhodospirillaceae bacterium]|nr:FkbM family methyltransferase [Rhodospirillaceae bacterium]MYB14291.1 FkbM family methyltransferase [Rhodospirillaceae bacterium]MYI48341.1 FkbM family methyltransferase [Rhodospirillaceae bacterium]
MAERQTGSAEAAAAAMRALPVRQRNRLLFDLLAEAGATGIVIPGANGEIEGSLADRTVILKYLKNKSWSVEAIRLMQAIFAGHGPGSWVDLGANIGAMTIPAAHAGAVCHAVEPEPSNLALLRRNIARNGVADRVTVHEAAAWHEAAALTFEIAPSNLGDHRLRTKAPGPDSAYGEAARETIAVAARPVDALIDAGSLAGPVLVKADVQGAEAQALAGGAALLGRADLALLEYWPYGLRRLGTDPASLFTAVRRHFEYAALLADDQAPETVRLVRFDDLTAGLLAAEEENRTVALDLVLSKERTPLWTG